MPKVHIVQVGRTLDVAAGTTILEAALDAGIDYPFGCQTGNCGSCKSRLVSGQVAMASYSEFALGEQEKSRGLILACRAVPVVDSEVAWIEEDDLLFHPRRSLACRLIGVEDATGDIKRIRLGIISGGPFDFSAGQFASVTFDGCPPRDYSMANVPGDPTLEFHVSHGSGGATSGYVRDRLKLGDEVHVQGPFGTSHLRESHPGPIIAVAGGSGLAPIKSIVERALALDPPRQVHLYFGVRTARGLYLQEHFVSLATKHADFHFATVVNGNVNQRAGMVQQAIATDFTSLDGCKAYLAGPPALVEAVAVLLEQRGLRRTDIHADAFYTAAEMARAGRKTGADL